MLTRRAPETFAGVLGWPLRHTLSPELHNAAFRAAGIDAVYLPFRVPPRDLAAAVAGARALGALGVNITMPHKQAALALVDELAGAARRTGAVNTVERRDTVLVGHNTDVEGFREFLSGDAAVDPSSGRVLVLGAGGAARAVVTAVVDLGAADIVVAARRAEAAAEVASLPATGRARPADWGQREAEALRADVIVDTTPAGVDDPLADVSFRAGQVVVDLGYAADAPLVRHARADGAAAFDGLGMLVRQAAASFRIWTGADPPVEVMLGAARAAEKP